VSFSSSSSARPALAAAGPASVFRALVGAALAGIALMATGCSGGDDERVPEPPPAAEWPNLECDPLVPGYCGYPFPSNVYTVDDAATPTGRRVSLSPRMMPVANNGALTSPEPFGASDGFSSAGAMLALMPGVVLAGAAGPNDVARSLEADSPTVVVDAETGERKAHFVELDVGGTEPEMRTLMIRPAERLADGRRYIVAIRGLPGADGVPLAPSPAFAELRDLLPTADPVVEARRPLYADIFQRLATAGIARADLQLAWDFTTTSRENNTGWMLHMRDEALAMVGEEGPPFTITSVETDPDARIAYAIRGTFEVPLYVDDHRPGGRLVFGDDGLPEPVGTHSVKFGLLIPKSATESSPVALLQYGHGLLGSFNQATGGAFRDLIDDYGYAIFGVTLWGMGQDVDGEWQDGLWIADRLSDGKIDVLASMFDRLHQGMLNQLLAMRMMRGGMAADPTYGPLLDGDTRYYHGISQGGIFGGTYMALSTEVERGVLGVMGMPYNLLLDRSVDFNPFFALMKFSFPDPRDRALLLGLIQLLWDRTEPNGYVPYLAGDTLPGTPSHAVLMRAAVGDHQVPTLGAHLMARAAGAVHLDSGVRPIWGLEAVDAATEGSAYVEYDFGLPEVPACNLPMTACDDPHGKVRNLTAAKEQLDLFLRTGAIQNFCDGGVCVFPELGGCEPGETATTCPP
jgi:hypothetical protein